MSGSINGESFQLHERSTVEFRPLKNENKSLSNKKPFQCQLCTQEFQYASLLRHHMVMHTGRKRHKCHVCKKTFSVALCLRRHMKTHRGEKPYRCQFCQKSFTLIKNLNDHKKTTHTLEKPLQRLPYPKTFTQPVHLKRDISGQMKEKQPLKCQICEKTYALPCDLETHITRSHNGENLCKSCPKTVDFPYLEAHLRKTHKCEVCQKSFTQLSAFTHHMLIHTEDKPYRCEFCPKAFTRSIQLTRHISSHTLTSHLTRRHDG